MTRNINSLALALASLLLSAAVSMGGAFFLLSDTAWRAADMSGRMSLRFIDISRASLAAAI